MKKKLLILGLVIFIIFVASLNDSFTEKKVNENEEPEVKEVVFEDYELKSTRPRTEFREYKYVGPGSVSTAEKIFIEYLTKEGWNFDYKEEDYFYNILFFRNGSSSNSLKITVGDYGNGEALVIIDEPYQ
jgi:hypothetical protein